MAEHDLNKIVDNDGEVFNLRDSTKQPVADRVTAWGSTPSDTKYPSEKLVKTALDGKQATLAFDGTYNASTNKAATVSTVTNAINGLDVSSVGGNGKYISAISETDGKISATATTMDTTPTASSTNAVTSDGVKTALDGKADDSDVVHKTGTETVSGAKTFNNTSSVFAGKCANDINGNPLASSYGVFRSELGEPTLEERGIIEETFANQLECLPKANAVYETSPKGTETWTTLDVPDYTHNLLWGGNVIGRLSISKNVDFRITINAPYYCWLNFLYFYAGGQGATFHIKLERKLNSSGAWSVVSDTAETSIGWPGHNTIRHSNISFSTSSSQYGSVRLTLYIVSTGNIESYPTYHIDKFRYYGGYPYKSDPWIVKKGSSGVTNFPKGITSGVAIPVGSGGTGKTSVTAGNYLVGNGTSALTEQTPMQVGNNVLPALTAGTGDNVFGTDYIIASNHASGVTDATTFVRRTADKLWEYIKSQISSVLGLTATSYGGNAATASAAQSGSALETAINGKVDKVTGKGLSTNDYTTTEKNKLAGIAEGATKVEASTTNGKVKINGTDTTVYTHPSQTAYTSKGTATKVPQITTDGTGHVTGITEVTISGVTPASHTHGNIQNGGALQTNDITIASGDKLVVTDSSDSNKVARTSVSFDGSTTTKALTQKGTFETFLTSHQSITGKMNTSGDNAVAPSGDGGNGATATLLNNLTGPNSLDDITSDNVLIPTTNSDGTDQTKWYKRPLSKLWPWILSHTQSRILKTSSDVYWGVGADANHYIDLDYDGRTSSPTVGVWVRWASGSGNAKYMAECDASGNCTFNGTSTHARYAYNTYNPGSGTAYWLKIGRVTSPASSGSAGGALTAIISSGFNTAGDDLSAQLIRVSIRSKGTSTNGVTIVGDNVTLGLKSVVLNADVRFAVHTVTSRTTSVDGVYDIYVERKGWHYVDVLQLHNDNVEMTYNSDTTKAISDTTNMTIFSPTLPYASTAAVGNLLAVANAAGTGVTQYYMRAIEYTSGGTTYIALTKNDGTSNVRVKSAENADGCDGWKFKVGSLGTATDTIYFIAGS